MATGRGQSSSHPCHNLSNPSKRLFWCRHCMAKFIDPIQRWRHSKTCKKIVSSNPRQEIVSTDGRILQVVAGTTEGSVVVSNLSPPEEPEPSVSKRKIRKLVMNDLKCQICERGFVSLDEMREHVKQPCRKEVPFEEQVIPVTGVSITLPDYEQKGDQEDEDEKASALNSLEANLQQMEQSLAMRSDVADEVVANQIESLLKAAQVLQQQQQQEQQSTTTYQLLGSEDLATNVDTQYVITTNQQYEDSSDQQFEAVTVETVATLENIVPQVAMCPEAAQQQVVLQPNVEPDDLQLISEVIAREEPEIGKHHSFVSPSSRTASTSSPPPPLNPVSAAEQTQETTSQSQMSTDISPTKDNLDCSNSSDKANSVGTETSNTISPEPGCVSNSINSDNNCETVCSNNEKDDVVKPLASNCCENGCCYDPTVDDFGFRSLIDDNDSQTNGPPKHCTCKLKSSSSPLCKSKDSQSTSRPPPKPPKYKAHETAKKMRTRSTSVDEEKHIPTKTVKKKRKYIGGKGSLDCIARSKRKKMKKSNTSDTKTAPQREGQNCDQNSSGTIGNGISVDKDSDRSLGIIENSETKQPEIKTPEVQSNACLPKPRKTKPAKEPKCRICDRVFKSIQLLQKHNKVPCKIKHTRNLCQKVLRPKRAPVEHFTSLKQKPKQTLASKKNKAVSRPQLLPVRRISDTTLFILPKAKKGGKKRRKSAPVFIYTPPVKEYKNTFLGIHMLYKTLPFKEKFFFDLGMISSAHLNKDSCDTMDFSGLDQSSQDVGDIVGPCTPPPVLEKIPDLDLFPMHSPSSCLDLEPPVLEVISDLRFDNSSPEMIANSTASVTPITPLVPQITAEEMPPVLETEDKSGTISDTVTQLSVNTMSLNKQKECVEEHSNTSGHESPETVKKQMSEIFTKYFNSPEKHKSNDKKALQRELPSRDLLKTDIASPNSKHEVLQEMISDQEQTDVHKEVLSSPKGFVKMDEIHDNVPKEDMSVPVICHQLHTTSEMNERTDVELPENFTSDVGKVLQPEGQSHMSLDEEMSQKGQTEHLHQEENVSTQSSMVIGDIIVDKSETSLSLPVTIENSETSFQLPVTMENSETTLPLPVTTENSETTLSLPVTMENSETSLSLPVTMENLETTLPLPVTMENSETTLSLPVTMENSETSLQLPVTMENSETTLPLPITMENSETSLQLPVTMENSETSLSLPVTMENSDTSLSLPVTMENSDNLCNNSELKQSTQSASGEQNSVSENVKNPATVMFSPSKSSSTRHFTDLLADLCSSLPSEGMTTDSLAWCKQQELPPHREPDHKESCSSVKSKDSPQKLGERHFMDAIMEAALEISKTTSAKVNQKSKTVQKVTVAVQTDAESFTAKLVAFRTDPVSTDLPCADMVGSETFESTPETHKVEQTERSDDRNSESSDLITQTDTNISSELDVSLCPNKTDLCTNPTQVTVQNVHLEVHPMESQESMPVESSPPQCITPEQSSTPTPEQPPPVETSPVKSSKKPGSSKESSPQKGEGRNLFESLFSSLGKESESNNSSSLANTLETITHPQNQINTHSDKGEAVSYPAHAKNTQGNSNDSGPNKSTFLKEKLPENVHVQQPNSQEVVVFPPPGCKLVEPTPDPAPQFVGRTTSLPLGLSREVPDLKNRTNLLEMVAKSLGIFPDENLDPQNEGSINKQTESSNLNLATRDSDVEKTNVFVNMPFVQSTSCVDETEDSSVQIIVMNNQSTSSDYTTDINVIDLPSNPELSKDQPDTVQLPSCCAADTLTNKGSCDKAVAPPVVSKPVNSQKPAVKVVMCGVKDLKQWDNTGVVVANKPSLQVNYNGSSSIETLNGVETWSEQSQTSNLCNTVSHGSIDQGNREVDGRLIRHHDTTSCVVSQSSLHTSTVSSTDYRTPITGVSSSDSPTLYNIHNASGVTMVTDIHLSTNNTNKVSEHVAMETNPINKPVTMDTGETVESEVTMVTNSLSAAPEKMNACPGSWGEPKVMVQYVQDFNCDQNVSYIVLDNEQENGSDSFVITESPFLPTGDTILCQEDESLLNSNDQPLQAAVMN